MRFTLTAMHPSGDQTNPINGQTDDKAADRPNVWTREGDERASDRAADRTQVTVSEAAQLLGLSAEAVRSRVQRGTLESTKIGGKVYVLLDADQTSLNRSTATGRRPNDESTDASNDESTARLLESQQDQINWLRREVERKDTIIMSLTQRIPELEAPAAEENPVTEWLGDEESYREDRGMSTRPDEARQRWHARTQEAPRAQRGGPEPASEGPLKGDAPAEPPEPISRPSWWRRFFGFE